MPKSRHHKRKNKPQSLFFNLSKELERIDALIEAGDTAEAMEQLKSLASRMPQRAEIFETMFMLAVELDDKRTLLEAAIRLAELQPNVPAHHFNLYGVYLQNLFPALALQTGQKFLSRWPDVELGKDIRQDREKILPHLREEAIRQQFSDDESWLEHLALHERVQVALSRNRFEESQRLAAQLINTLPYFVPAYNNRSLACFMNGQFDEAIADARRALAIDPGNVHALGNLTRFLRLANRLAEARERLKTVFALEHFHFDEFMNFCQAQIMFFIIGDSNPEAASHWLRMWEQLTPDHPNLDLFRPLVKNPPFARRQAMSFIEWLRE